MHWQWTYNFGLIVNFLIAEVLSTPQHANYYYSETLDDNAIMNRKTSRQKRQIETYNDDTTTPPLQGIIESTCTFNRREDNNQCTINIKTLGYDHALILNSTDPTKLIYPKIDGSINFKQNQTVVLSCPGQNNSFKSDSLSWSRNLTCLCGSAFSSENQAVYDFYELTCKLPPKYEIVDKGFYGRESEYRKFEIGFHTSRPMSQFLSIVEVHYDRSSTSTMYVKSTLSRYIAARQKLAKSLDGLDQTHCCERRKNRLDMNVIYAADSQDRSFAAQLYCHDSEFLTRCSYLNVSSAIIFNPAQLTPKNSMVYTSSGSATFVYLNTAPQWRPINEGNWARIEDHIVEMAKELGKDLIIYTGVYDRLTLNDTGDGNRTKMMFLHAADNSEKSIGIPLYFWKIVYEAESKRGVVYVTVNNIFIVNVDNYHLCEKPMFTKDGVRMPKQWKPKNLAKGYSYMCEVPDFMRNIAVITFHGFSPAVVTDLLYLVKK